MKTKKTVKPTKTAKAKAPRSLKLVTPPTAKTAAPPPYAVRKALRDKTLAIGRGPTPAQLERREARERKERAERVAKMVKAIGKRADERCASFAGRAAGEGWVLAATDGHRAVLLPGTAAGADPLPAFFGKMGAIGIDFTQDVVGAFRRMMAASSSELEYRVRMELTTASSKAGELTLTVTNPGDGVEAKETVEVNGEHLRPFHGNINAKYVVDMGGFYPAKLRVTNAGSALLVQMVSADIRIIVIGFGGKSDGTNGAVFLAGQAKDVPVAAPSVVALPVSAPAPPPAAAAPASPAVSPQSAPRAARPRPSSAPGPLTACECCGQPSVKREATTGKTRFSHKCPHGNPCPTGVAKKTIAACPTCREAQGAPAAPQAVSA